MTYKWLSPDDPGSPVEGVGEPAFTAADEEEILGKLTIEDAEDPDGVKTVPKQEDFNKLLKEEMTGEFEAPKPAEEESEVEELDEADILKDSGYDKVEDLVEGHKAQAAQIAQITELMTAAGYQVSDNVMADMIETLEQQALAKQPGFLTGAQPEAAPNAEVVDPRGVHPPAPPAPSPGEVPQQFTNALLAEFPSLKWHPSFVAKLAQAVGEHLPKAAPAPTGDFISRQDMQVVATLNKNLFRDQMVNEHIIDRQATGEKLPANFRTRLRAEMDKNPKLLEQAWRGYLLRGSNNGVMDDYSRTLRADEDPNTGLTGAEADAAADEKTRMKTERKTMRGGDAPKTGGKKKAPSVVELESSIEALAKKVI